MTRYAVGVDSIAFRYIKESLLATAFYHTVIINTFTITGAYPSLLKNRVITSIFKSRDAEQIDNYRPITLLTVISKVLEENICKSIINNHF